jgi:hypothetical protein
VYYLTERIFSLELMQSLDGIPASFFVRL